MVPLIRVTSEGLNLQSLAPYTAEEFGFIVDTSGIYPAGKNAILSIGRRGFIYGGLDDDIEVGVVKHRRDRAVSFVRDCLGRTTGVEIISLGGGVRRGTLNPTLNPAPLSPIPQPT